MRTFLMLLCLVYGTVRTSGLLGQSVSRLCVDSIAVKAYQISQKEGLTGMQYRRIVNKRNPNVQISIKDVNETDLLVRMIERWSEKKEIGKIEKKECLIEPIDVYLKGDYWFFSITIYSNGNEKNVLLLRNVALSDNVLYTNNVHMSMMPERIIWWYIRERMKELNVKDD